MPCTNADFAYLRSVVLEQSFNSLDASRDYLFESRLHPLLNATGLQSLDRLVEALRRQSDPALRRSVAEAMTVNETSFFRDRGPFELMRIELLPKLIRRRASTRHLRLWSAACSTGQEAYSLAMTLRENFPQIRNWKIEITGTDISASVVQRAQQGRYQRLEVNRGLPARYLIKYFQRISSEWEVVPELKRMCRFHHRNLCNSPMLVERFDGILLRNVMLYFSEDTRRQLLLNLHRLLEPDGFLILGSSEQPGLPEHFQPFLAYNTCYYTPIVQHPR
jgi:chemotaxis protein methyltransferase CheR